MTSHQSKGKSNFGVKHHMSKRLRETVEIYSYSTVLGNKCHYDYGLSQVIP